MDRFNKPEAEYELNAMKLSHSFALKMALMICWSVVSMIIILGITTTKTLTPMIIGIITAIVIILGVISFSITRSACL